MLSLQGLIDANEISQYAVVNQYGAAVPAEAELLPAVADAFDNVTAHAASISVMVSSSRPPLTTGILFTL